MIKQSLIFAFAFLLGVIACVYTLAISNNSASLAPNDAWAAAGQQVVELRSEELPVAANTPETVATSSALDKAQASTQTLVVHPKELDIEPVEQSYGPVVNEVRTEKQYGGLDEESIREVENVHLKGRQLKTIPPELLPPAEDVKLHQEEEAELLSQITDEANSPAPDSASKLGNNETN